MFKVGDLVVYSGSGVCIIDSIGAISLSGSNAGKTYYTMRPSYGQGVIYIPEDTEKSMRYLISAEEVKQIIDLIPTMPENIYTGDIEGACSEDYLEFYKEHNCEDLIPLIKTIYVKPSAFTPMGKRVPKVDKNFIRQTEDLLFGEFSEALKMGKNEVREYVEKELQRILGEKYALVANG